MVVAVDAAADPVWDFTDLNHTLEGLAKRGWMVQQKVLPEKGEPPPLRHAGVGRIDLVGPDATSTTVIVLKASMAEDALALMSSGARDYAGTHPAFPQEATANQWFKEAQFEAYFAVGRALARRLEESALLPSTAPRSA